MAVRRQRATTSQEIMEKDIDITIKKAKVCFRYGQEFYIHKYTIQDTDYYFASGYPEDKREPEQKWIFNNNRWEEV